MILIIAAMQEEVVALKALGQDVQDITYLDIPLVKMTLSGKSVLLSQSGIGKINAAYTTAVLTQHFNPELIINIGSAGGLVENQTVGDIVMADVVLSHDLDIGPDTHNDPRFIYYPDIKAAKLAEKVASDLGHKVYHGKIVSGDQFVTNGSYAYNRILDLMPEAICVEMEASAIGGAASRMKTPFIVIRALSDVPLKLGNEVEFDEYLALASQNSAKICEAFLSEY